MECNICWQWLNSIMVSKTASRKHPLTGGWISFCSDSDMKMSTSLTCHLIVHFCRARGCTQPDLSFQNACTALPSLHSPIHTPCPLSCLTQSSGQWWREGEGGLRLDEGLVVGVYIVEKKRTSLIRNKNGLSAWSPVDTPGTLKKFFFKCPVGSIKLFIEESALSFI